MKRHPKDKSPNAIEFALKHRACRPAIRWLEREKIETLAQAWAHCHNGAWMHWLLWQLYYESLWLSGRSEDLFTLIPKCSTSPGNFRRGSTIRRLIHAQYSEYYIK